MGGWRTSSTVDASQLFKRSVMSDLAHATDFGRVVGCEGHWFEVLYEDGDDEALSWHDLSRVLACRTQRARCRAGAAGVGARSVSRQLK